MTRLSDSQLELSRVQPQRAKLYLSIFHPQAIMKCRLNNASAARGDRVIPYDGVSLGDYSAVEENFFMKVGTADGLDDLGSIRIRSATNSQFVVSENNTVKWQDDAFLTIYRYVRLDPVYPRIVQSQIDPETVYFFKDYDIPYSNQNSILGTFPCMGNHQALFKGERVYYSNTGSYNLTDDSLSHSWFFEGASVTGSTDATPGYITYPTPGYYSTRYIVSGSNGSVDTSYRYVSVYDRPGEGSSPPIEKWQLVSLNGSRGEGGYTCSIRVNEDVEVEENSIVVLFSEEWYGSTKQSLGGNSPNNERIFFVGYVLKGSIRKNYRYSYVDFEIGSITEVMKKALGFAVSVESKASPAYWYELIDMDCRRAIYHYLRWHSTALQVADFQFLGDDRKIQFFDADRTSMYDAIDNLMRDTLLGKVVSDRQGKVWIEVDARAYSNPTGSFSSVMEITKRDWLDEPSIDQEFSDRLSYYEAGGIAYSGVITGTYSAMLACAPGSAPAFRGSIEMPEGLALEGQEQLNQLVGNVFANANAKLPKISMGMTGMRKNLDIAPQESVQMTITAADTLAGVPVDGLYIPESIEWNYDPRKQSLRPRIDFERVVSGDAGETVEIASSSDEAGLDTGFKVPQLKIPPLPLLTIPPLFSGVTSGSVNQAQVNNSIETYQADYGSAVYSNMPNTTQIGWFTEARGTSVLTASVGDGGGYPSVIRIQVSKAGLYSVIASASVANNVMTITPTYLLTWKEVADQQIAYALDGLGFSAADENAESTNPSAGRHTYCNSGEIIHCETRHFNSSSASDWTLYYMILSVARISG